MTCKHTDVSIREDPDIRPKWVGDAMATAHRCLDCREVLWRLHPSPRRMYEPREKGSDRD